MPWNRRPWSLERSHLAMFRMQSEDETSVEKLRSIPVAIFVVSTTGQGPNKLLKSVCLEVTLQ